MPSLVETGPIVLKWKFLNILYIFFINLLFLRKVWAFICKNLYSIYPRIFVPNVVEIGLVVLKSDVKIFSI